MSDYAVLVVIAASGISGGLFLLFQAKNYRAARVRRGDRARTR